MIEFRVEVSDGTSLFSTNVYVGYQELDETVAGLDSFRKMIHNGIFDSKWGGFDPKYANGAFRARFQFARPGRLYITCHLQSEFREFAISGAHLHKGGLQIGKMCRKMWRR